MNADSENHISVKWCQPQTKPTYFSYDCESTYRLPLSTLTTANYYHYSSQKDDAHFTIPQKTVGMSTALQ